MMDLKTTKLVHLGFFPPNMCYKHLYFLSVIKNEEGKGKEKYTKINIKQKERMVVVSETCKAITIKKVANRLYDTSKLKFHMTYSHSIWKYHSSGFLVF